MMSYDEAKNINSMLSNLSVTGMNILVEARKLNASAKLSRYALRQIDELTIKIENVKNILDEETAPF